MEEESGGKKGVTYLDSKTVLLSLDEEVCRDLEAPGGEPLSEKGQDQLNDVIMVLRHLMGQRLN